MSVDRCEHGVIVFDFDCTVRRCYRCEPLTPGETRELIRERDELRAKLAAVEEIWKNPYGKPAALTLTEIGAALIGETT